jgi:hypothetical protein
MKTFSTSGTGSQQILSEIESDKIPIYDSLTDVEADLANLEVGQIVATKDTGSELSAPVDTVQSGNMHAVTSNAVAKSLSYSTTEHKTGKKWIGGKEIYSLVIPINNQVSVLNNYDLTDKNIEWVTKSDVMVYNDNKQHIETNLIDYNISTKKLVATSQLWCSYAILEYTKTTD